MLEGSFQTSSNTALYYDYCKSRCFIPLSTSSTLYSCINITVKLLCLFLVPSTDVAEDVPQSPPFHWSSTCYATRKSPSREMVSFQLFLQIPDPTSQSSQQWAEHNCEHDSEKVSMLEHSLVVHTPPTWCMNVFDTGDELCPSTCLERLSLLDDTLWLFT